MTQTLTEQDRYLYQFRAMEESLSLNGAGWLRPLRRAAFERFAELGFPMARRGNEAWKYTSVAPIARGAFDLGGAQQAAVAAPDLRRLAPHGRGWAQLVFVDGRYVESLSTPGATGGLRLTNLADAAATDRDVVERHLARHAPYDNDAFTALNTAFLRDGAFVHAGPGRELETPVHLIHISGGHEAPTVSHPRTLVVVSERSRVTVIESFVSLNGAAHFTNGVTEIVVGDGAAVEHCRLFMEGPAAYHVGMTRAWVGRDSVFGSTAIARGGALVRNDLGVLLDGPGASCQLNGLSVTAGGQHVDNHTSIDHATHHTSSRQYYKGILDGTSKMVFSGRVLVRPDAQKTEAHQTNKNLLLSEGAEVDTKPSLEIFADDVQCTHGAAAGQLDEETVFYLRSRGLDPETARRLLVRGFASEILDTVRVHAVRTYLDRLFLREQP